VTLADVLARSVVNQATAFGSPASGGGAISALTNDVTVPYSDAPALTLTKTASRSTFKAVGEVVTYTLTVRNTGPVTLDNVIVSDPLNDGSTSVCNLNLIASLEVRTCTATHAITAAELGAPLVNTAHAHATTGSFGSLDVDSNTVTVNFLPEPKIAVSMSASPYPSFSTLGATLNYSMTITNTGNVPLSSVGIANQTLAGATAPVCAASTLAVGAATTCTSSYTTTTADASASVTNQVTARGTYASSTITATSSSVTVNSAVPCSVTNITANLTSVGRQGGSGHLDSPVLVTASTTGVCSGLRIRYYPQNAPSGVIDVMSGGSGTWSYTIPNSGNKASKWDPGPAQVDVLPTTGTTALHTTIYRPFTVS
jgi:uncharacterized repeat protein (TIGR01451 family)